MSDIIKPCTGYQVGDALFPILEDAQKAALCRILDGAQGSEQVADMIVKNREEVMTILSLDPPKQRKPRSDRGSKRKNAAPQSKADPAEPPPGTTVEGSGKYKGK